MIFVTWFTMESSQKILLPSSGQYTQDIIDSDKWSAFVNIPWNDDKFDPGPQNQS